MFRGESTEKVLSSWNLRKTVCGAFRMVHYLGKIFFSDGSLVVVYTNPKLE
jgi:hypothetical protein